jgi:hypothetical protein
MQEIDVLDRHLRDEGLGRPLHRALTFSQAGLVLGRDTLLAEFENERPGGLALDGHGARVLSLLTAAHGKPVAGGVVEKIRRAGEFWCAGEKTLAQIHLAFLGLPKIDEADAYRLFLAGLALEKGIEPIVLMKALGFPRAGRALEKYNPDQPRIPAGSGRESGEWTSGDGGDTPPQHIVRRVDIRAGGATISDANPPGIVPGAQYAQLSPTPIITPADLKHIVDNHGLRWTDPTKGRFIGKYATEDGIRDLIMDAWNNATPDDLAANEEGRVLIAASSHKLTDDKKNTSTTMWGSPGIARI